MIAIVFPSNPTTGQEFVASNGATYIFSGSYWSSVTAIEDGSASYIYEGGYAGETYNEIFDNTLEGGDANGN
jgi:hypothetical protein